MKNIADGFHNISIKRKIIILGLIMILYPIILVIIFGMYNNEKIIKDRFVSYVENDVMNAKVRMSNDLDFMEEIFQEVLYNIDAYDLFRSKPKDININNTMLEYKFQKDMNKYLKSTIFAKQEFDLVTMQFVSDNSVYYAAKEKGLVNIGKIPKEEFKKVTEDNNQVLYYFDKEDNGQYIYLVRSIYDINSFDKIGIMSFRIDNNYLQEILSHTYREPAESTYLYTYEGDRIVYAGRNYNNQIIESKKLYLNEKGTYTHTINGNNYYVIVETIDDVNLKIISVITTDMLISDTRKVFDLIIILCIISMPIYIIIANMIYSEIISPFNLLVSKMKDIEKGELNTSIDIIRKNEIGYLYNSFNSMAKRLKYLVECVYEEEIARKNAEISALQSQINPHFLYNTLETINWKAQLSGEQDIAEMVQALSKLMDANMNRNGEKFSTIEQEIQYMDSFLFLIQKRFGKKIEYDKIIDQNILKEKLPKLIIQPIVENAIKHGIEPVGRGKILIGISEKDEKLIIEVEDNGAGIEVPKLKSINVELSDNKYIAEEQDNSKSIGLKNVYRRLLLIYGKEAEISILSTYTKGTKVTLKVPKTVLTKN
ncbi:sensor histidine kinase [Vallitalea guaymasensis]|uniref:Histidine kinase n=1 Tax=Vallitalea guaymasensis TaxID=1185412 RepID=A0A8J8M9C8_9FIRM|nr:histidine kinase [Vallitalea guaymasensis]QUH28729.1 histidine kinase [Vallitalea guaymasensis]